MQAQGAGRQVSSMTTTAAKSTNLADAIFHDIVARILRGEFAPGTRLRSERDLSADYDTNRNTLREAIRKLEHTRLVTVRHGQGVTVTDWRRQGAVELLGPYMVHSPDQTERLRALTDLLMARIRVLEMAVALAAERAEPADIAAIEAVVASQQAAFAAQDRDALVLGDMHMVNALVHAAHSLTVRWIANTVVEVYRELVQGAKALWIFEPTFPGFLGDLVDRIAAGDGDGAAALVRDYYTRSDDKLLSMLGKLLPPGQRPTP